MAIAERESGKHIDVTLSAEQYARVQREAEKRGLTLAGYIRHRVLDGGREPSGDATAVSADAPALLPSLQQLSADVRALAVVMAGVGAVVADASEEDRETLTRSTLDLFDKMRRVHVKDEDGSR